MNPMSKQIDRAAARFRSKVRRSGATARTNGALDKAEGAMYLASMMMMIRTFTIAQVFFDR
jgi:hypothetical protein